MSVRFEALKTTDLIVDEVYEGGPGVDREPLQAIFRCGIQGGFRQKRTEDGRLSLVVLFSSLVDADWPDTLNLESGTFLYYGDNKAPGSPLHETHRGGNKILRDVFADVHSTPARRDHVPPFFIFDLTPFFGPLPMIEKELAVG